MQYKRIIRCLAVGKDIEDRVKHNRTMFTKVCGSGQRSDKIRPVVSVKYVSWMEAN